MGGGNKDGVAASLSMGLPSKKAEKRHLKKAKATFRARLEEAREAGESAAAVAAAKKRSTMPFRKRFLVTCADGGSSSAHVNDDDPVDSIDDPRLPPCFSEHFRSEKFESPSPVQRVCWPALLSGSNAVVCAPTGSGKTLGFLLPMSVHVSAADSSTDEGAFPRGLVLSPTRELAQQIAAVARKLVNVVCLCGGTNKEKQLDALLAKPPIIVATPGRLIDLVTASVVSLSGVTMLVVDEADRMLDVGFEEQLMRIHSMVRPDRQSALFSATFTSRIKGVTDAIVAQPRKELFLSGTEGFGDIQVGISPSVTQIVHVCAEHKKPKKLMKFLKKLEKEDEGKRQATSVLVFCNHIKTVLFLSKFLRKEGQRAADLHGNLPQPQRERVLADFKAGKIRILVSTDVAARGLHVRCLDAVVNYDMSPRLEQYVHRVGRTGRQGRQGVAYTFLTRNFAFLAPDLVDLLTRYNQAVDPNMKALALSAPAIRAPGASPPGKSKKKKKSFGDRGDLRGVAFKDRCWLAGSNGIAKPKGGADAAKDAPANKNGKRKRGKRGGKKNKKKSRQ